jgi:hypothetical protein
MAVSTPAVIVTGGGVDNSLPPFQGGPDNSLPGIERPVDPSYGWPLPPVISGGPVPPPGVWPPQTPTYPVDPGYDLPMRPGIWPNPPRPPHVSGGPVPGGGRPDQGLPPIPAFPNHDLPIFQGGPNNDLPMPPGSVWPPLPPSMDGKYMCFVWIVGVGYRFTVIDTNLEINAGPIIPPSLVPGHPDHSLPPVPGHPGHPLPPAPARPDNTLPPTEAQPRRG